MAGNNSIMGDDGVRVVRWGWGGASGYVDGGDGEGGRVGKSGGGGS